MKLITQGMMDEIVEVLEFKTENVQLATLETLSSACSDKACRSLIIEKCSVLLFQLSLGKNSKLRSAALSTLIKLMAQNKDLEKKILSDASSIVDTFSSVIISNDKVDGVVFARSGAIESLAYLSTHGIVKRMIISNGKLIKALFALSEQNDRATRYGLSMILANLTAYKRKLTEEEEQVEKIRVMAKEAVPTVTDPEDTESMVEKRGELVTSSGIFPVLVSLAKTASANVKGKSLVPLTDA